jgi:hypothetical protein
MVLILRPTKPEKAPAFDNLADWTVLNDGEEIGRIFEVHAPARPELAWVWSIARGRIDPGSKIKTQDTLPISTPLKQRCANWAKWKAWGLP